MAASADQEQLREKARRNLQALRDAAIPAPHALGVVSALWMRSLSAAHDAGGTRQEVQLDVTGGTAVDDNSFTAELAEIVDNSFNIHEVGTTEKRYCFKLPGEPRIEGQGVGTQRPLVRARHGRSARTSCRSARTRSTFARCSITC